MNFQQQATQLKDDLRTAMKPFIEAFHKETGVLPQRVSIHAIDISTFGDLNRYVLGEVSIEFKL